jgi:hypothetical protein
MFVFPDQCLGRADLAVVQAMILRQFKHGLKPEFRFPIRVMHMNMKSGFLARKEEESEPIFAENCRAHGRCLRQLTSL